MADLSSARQRLRTPTTSSSPSATHDPSRARPLKQSVLTRLWRAMTVATTRSMQWLRHGHKQTAMSSIFARLRQLPVTTGHILRTLLSSKALTRRRVIIALIGLLVIWWLLPRQSPTPSQTKSTEAIAPSQTKSSSLPKEKPSFTTVLPAGKNISELGGWTKVSPPGKDPVYAYVDSIAGIQINVSEQALPATLKGDDAIRQLAESFDARETIKAGAITVYIGTSVKGPQSLIFRKDNLLVLIKSSNRIAEPLWQNYITSLR